MSELLVNIDVDDLEQARAFYCDALGLRMGRRLGPGVIELLGGQAPIFLRDEQSGSVPFVGAATPRSYVRHWTPVHLDFVVGDLDEAVARAERAGARREGSIEDHAWGRIAYFADPFGHGFCLVKFHGRGYDELTEQR
jgi:lactoylglutathione lyase